MLLFATGANYGSARAKHSLVRVLLSYMAKSQVIDYR
jgi:hypothetical protein